METHNGHSKTAALLRQSAIAARTLLPQAENELKAARARVEALRILSETAPETGNPVDQVLGEGPMRFKDLKAKMERRGIVLAVSSIYATLGKGKKAGRYANQGGVWSLTQ